MSKSICCLYRFLPCLLVVGMLAVSSVQAQTAVQNDPNETKTAATSSESKTMDWNQWRGPNRDGKTDVTLPSSLDEKTLTKKWSVPMQPSYSGPIVVGDRVFTTQTVDRKFEEVIAVDRETGEKLWSQQWPGSLSVPMFAKANGDWIRATPAYDDGRLYVAGMRDVLVCLGAEKGEVIWKIDFPAETKSSVPSFGMVCSPLIDGDFVYIQAGGGFCKIDKKSGKIIWNALKDGGGMFGSAFSSPIIETVAGKRQAIVQTRQALVGVDLESGEKLWSENIKSFRGMNIITPTVFESSLFVSTYGGVSQLLTVSGSDSFEVKQNWAVKAEGYMTTPVVVGGFAYTHLKNQRLACFDLKKGVEAWRSKPFGKYSSLIASGDKILALDQKGDLMLIKANPNEFELISKRKVGSDSWAHLAVRGNQIFIRNLDELVAYEFSNGQ
ncbi:MAG: PQQ-binding-like beta-propeller repeat protein [Planctomycetota bacterium]